MRALDRGSRSWRGVLVALAVVTASGCASAPTIARWDPTAFRDLNTLEFLTVGDEGKHWSTVWLVVLDDQVYIRLGSRAAGRMQGNASAPLVAVRIGGREYEHVRAEETAAMAERVGTAMRAKYWTDVFVRYINHPLTMRLVPDTAAGAP